MSYFTPSLRLAQSQHVEDCLVVSIAFGLYIVYGAPGLSERCGPNRPPGLSDACVPNRPVHSGFAVAACDDIVYVLACDEPTRTVRMSLHETMSVAQSIIAVAEAHSKPWQAQRNYHPIALDRTAKSTSAAPLLGPRSREVKHWDTPRVTQCESSSA